MSKVAAGIGGKLGSLDGQLKKQSSKCRCNELDDVRELLENSKVQLYEVLREKAVLEEKVATLQAENERLSKDNQEKTELIKMLAQPKR